MYCCMVDKEEFLSNVQDKGSAKGSLISKKEILTNYNYIYDTINFLIINLSDNGNSSSYNTFLKNSILMYSQN